MRIGIENMNSGLLVPKHNSDSSYLSSLETDPQYEDTLTSQTTNSDSEVNKSIVKD